MLDEWLTAFFSLSPLHSPSDFVHCHKYRNDDAHVYQRAQNEYLIRDRGSKSQGVEHNEEVGDESDPQHPKSFPILLDCFFTLRWILGLHPASPE